MEETKKDGISRDDIFSKVVRAGRRTYFFDVKATRNDDYYLTLTESKKNSQDDGSVQYEKHKIFLYKEDFDKFAEGLLEAINYIKEEKGATESTSTLMEDHPKSKDNGEYTSDVSFEDLAE